MSQEASLIQNSQSGPWAAMKKPQKVFQPKCPSRPSAGKWLLAILGHALTPKENVDKQTSRTRERAFCLLNLIGLAYSQITRMLLSPFAPLSKKHMWFPLKKDLQSVDPKESETSTELHSAACRQVALVHHHWQSQDILQILGSSVRQSLLKSCWKAQPFWKTKHPSNAEA